MLAITDGGGASRAQGSVTMAHGQGNMASRLSSVEASGCVLVCSTATRGYGATAARLTPDQKVGSSNLSGLNNVEVETGDG